MTDFMRSTLETADNLQIRAVELDRDMCENLYQACYDFIKQYPEHSLSKLMEKYSMIEIKAFKRSATIATGMGNVTVEQTYYIGIPSTAVDDNAIQYSDEWWLFLPEESILQFIVEHDATCITISDLIVTRYLKHYVIGSFAQIIVLRDKHLWRRNYSKYYIQTIFGGDCNEFMQPKFTRKVLGDNNDMIEAINRHHWNENYVLERDMQDRFIHANSINTVHITNRIMGGIVLQYHMVTLLKNTDNDDQFVMGRCLLCDFETFQLLSLMLSVNRILLRLKFDRFEQNGEEQIIRLDDINGIMIMEDGDITQVHPKTAL